jgi:hypothetical protein
MFYNLIIDAAGVMDQKYSKIFKASAQADPEKPVPFSKKWNEMEQALNY